MSTETITPDESLATSAEHPVLSVQGVVKRFGSNIVLRHLDLDVHRHEVVVLLEPQVRVSRPSFAARICLSASTTAKFSSPERTSPTPESTQIRFVRKSGSYSSTTICSRTCQ